MDDRSRHPSRLIRTIPVLVLGGVLAVAGAGRARAQETAVEPTAAAAPDPALPPSPSADEEEAAALADAVDAAAEDARSYPVNGFVSLSYRARKRGDRDDQDLYGYVSASGGDASRDDVTFHLLGRATYDFDGDAGDPRSLFFSLNDLGGESLDLHLYEAWIELRNGLAPTALGVAAIRLGRQNVFAGYSYLLDGVRVDFQRVKELGKLEVSIYGGIPEYLYERSRSGDWLAGTDLTVRPFDGTRIDLRYAHVEDDNRWVGGSEVDDYLAITLRQELAEDLFATVEWNTIDFETRDVRLRVDWALADLDLYVHAAYRYQASITREFTTELDPYVAVLGDSFAYHQGDLQVSKLFGEHFGADAGFTIRRLRDGGDEGPFNREYVRAFLTLSSLRWPLEDLDLSVTGELWEGDEDDAASAGFEATWRATGDVRVIGGVYYSLFKYDLFVVDEREDATTLYLKVRWEFLEDFRLDGRYEYETGDEGAFHAVWVGLTWSF